jgi:hypothetical protein
MHYIIIKTGVVQDEENEKKRKIELPNEMKKIMAKGCGKIAVVCSKKGALILRLVKFIFRNHKY